MHSITLRFLAASAAPSAFGRIQGGTVLLWADEAGLACASAWAHCACTTAFVGSTSFLRPVRQGDLVEVEARLVYTGSSSMSMAIEVRAGSIQSGELQPVTHCVAVYAAVDDEGQPRTVDAWTPETPGDIALAQRVKGHIDAEHAAQ
ncbi:acyl-CoA thioesterase [Acidovorax carolinensis]|uniref:Acyl-CoA thioesterase n=1 Tax=Acidovorax carolinensis TaxID=553814 RepID=A0A240UGD7_9BURK|nr:hotdog domain-containing protein [Acidovorax carolinensis]ART53870.1 acyl-CoA thioesterase [Acidovorax carolinensis]ART60538.1 acyl-CoA thioesterase [Acidovorax carolinensis]